MKFSVETELEGEVRGSVFTTSSLVFDSSPLFGAPALPEEERGVTVVWKDEQGWRLKQLSRGNEPASLPGKDRILTAQQIREGRPLKIFIVVANHNSSLFSCYNWLRYGKHGLRTLSVNLDDAQDAGNTSDERLRAIARNFSTQIGPVPFEDPIELIHHLKEFAETPPEAILLRNFDALDDQTAERFFGRLRALYEDSFQARTLPSLVLLGHSTAPLDPEEKGPVSSLLKLAECYTLSSLRDSEVQKMAERFARQTGNKKARATIQHIMTWTGGHPLLVQAIFHLLQTNPEMKSVEDATRFIERERLPAFEVWVQRLKESLSQPEIGRVVGILLRKGRFLRGPFEHRASMLELLVQGWIHLDSEDAWIFRSECHRKLAAEAFGQRG